MGSKTFPEAIPLFEIGSVVGLVFRDSKKIKVGLIFDCNNIHLWVKDLHEKIHILKLFLNDS